MRHLVLALTLAACGGSQHGGGDPPPPDAAPVVVLDEAGARETAGSLIDFLGAMAAIVDERSVAPDCPAMAKDLDALFTQSAPLFEIVKQAEADPGSKQRLLAAFDAQEALVGPLVERIGAGLEKCHDDPDVQIVMQRMPVL